MNLTNFIWMITKFLVEIKNVFTPQRTTPLGKQKWNLKRCKTFCFDYSCEPTYVLSKIIIVQNTNLPKSLILILLSTTWHYWFLISNWFWNIEGIKKLPNTKCIICEEWPWIKMLNGMEEMKNSQILEFAATLHKSFQNPESIEK